MDIKKIAREVYKTVDKNYPIPNQLYVLMMQSITNTLREQLKEETIEINKETDRIIKESKSCTEERIIGLAYERVLLNLGLRN